MLVSVSLTGGIADLALNAVASERAEYEFQKRMFDIVISLTLLILLSPVMFLLALAVRFTSKGPVVFKQKRLTKDGKVFMMYKFRSMFENAEEASGAVWACADDPRVTIVGRFLRQTRLDELPQLVNVLKDEMSLIGPRPERPEIAEVLAKELPYFQQRLAVKAGITGLAQVQSGYADNMERYHEKLQHDMDYIRRMSLKLDFKIALQTIKVVLTGAGAH